MPYEEDLCTGGSSEQGLDGVGGVGAAARVADSDEHAALDRCARDDRMTSCVRTRCWPLLCARCEVVRCELPPISAPGQRAAWGGMASRRRCVAATRVRSVAVGQHSVAARRALPRLADTEMPTPFGRRRRCSYSTARAAPAALRHRLAEASRPDLRNAGGEAALCSAVVELDPNCF